MISIIIAFIIITFDYNKYIKVDFYFLFIAVIINHFYYLKCFNDSCFPNEVS